jgi:hypothetical protein
MINIQKNKLPNNAKEGDVIDINGYEYLINVKETNKRRKEIEEILKDILNE